MSIPTSDQAGAKLQKTASYMWNVRALLNQLEAIDGNGHRYCTTGHSSKCFVFEGSTDTLVTCCGWTWSASRSILCQGSDVFARMLCQFEEGQTGMICLENDDPEAIRVLLMHFYEPVSTENMSLACYPPISLPEWALQGWWTQNVYIFKIADKFNAISLRRLAEECILHQLENLQDRYVNGCWYLMQAVFDLEQKGTAKLKVAASKLLRRGDEWVSRGLEDKMQDIGFDVPKNFDVVGELLDQHQNELEEEIYEYELLKQENIRNRNKARCFAETVEQLREIVLALPESTAQIQMKRLLERQTPE